MIDENTQTDQSFSQVQSSNLGEKLSTKSTPAIWIPWSEESNADRLSEAIQVEKSSCPKKNRKPTTESSNIKIPVDEYKIQKVKTNTDPDVNLLDICTRFLASPVLQILDLAVLD
jgi:hypothetical protein